MAIVTIGQIKHRRGILGIDPMPQLASAELGWAVDQQELYIGNGTISEGAPIAGNTEILTEHSNLVSLLDYIYTGPFSGASMSTSPGLPIERTFVDRYDDNVSVRAFGATGDGSTDDIDFLEQAIYQHTLEQPGDNEYWTTIYVPAGTYNISRPLAIPSRVRLVGDGFTSTIIKLTVASTSVLAIEEMTDPNTLGLIYPEDIHIVGIGFETGFEASNGAVISDAKNVLFENVSFDGIVADTTVVGTSNAAVLFANVTRPSIDIRFQNCLFTRATYGIVTGTPGGGSDRSDVNNIIVSNSRFFDLYKGVNLGEDVDGGFDFPHNWSIVHNTFDKVTKQGIHCFEAAKITSGHNSFADVGNDQLGLGSPSAPNITFGDIGAENPVDTLLTLAAYEGNYSIGDVFDRDDADNAVVLRLETNCLNSYAIDPTEIHWGTLKTEPGRLILLADNTAAPASTGVTLDNAQYQGAIIDYQLNRTGDQVRMGTIEIANGTTGSSFTETFTEQSPVGVTFSTSFAAGVTTLEYTSTDDAFDIVFSYSIRHLTCIAAAPTAAP